MMFALWMPMSCYFYPRPPRGGRLDPHRFTAVSLDISIHALREEGDLLAEIVKPVELISIHALREEGDFFSAVLHPAQSDFYPRPPRGGRPNAAVSEPEADVFLSTPSARRATDAERLTKDMEEFLSTPSARRATDKDGDVIASANISIHALREEGDAFRVEQEINPPSDFYPRPPRGGRREAVLYDLYSEVFLSTPSARRATRARWSCGRRSVFLSTPSARRATRPFAASPPPVRNFYPRPPRGGRRSCAACGRISSAFLSTPSARRATGGAVRAVGHLPISIHALREEGDLAPVRSRP